MKKELKSKDLRIGNLVYNTHTGEIDNVTLNIFMSIESLGINTKYSPIPLTEELLLKFGFEEKGVIFRINKNTENEFDVYIRLKTKEFYFGGAFRSYQIKYVHQLQNLYFALTGEELELKHE